MLPFVSESGPAHLQRTFAEALLSDEAPIPATVHRASGPAYASRFGVYRNNVIASLVKAIAVRYPVVCKLLWDDAFARVARLYVTSEPPRSPVMHEYGEGFPRFLRSIGHSVASDYLADVAELEAARTRAYHAADATPVARSAFAALAPEDLPGLRIRLHPSVVLLNSRFPVVSIWEANCHRNDKTIRRWVSECALVARPHLEVEVWRLSAGVHVFITALAEGLAVGEAIARGTANGIGFDLGECFEVLIAAQIAVDLVLSEGSPDVHI